MNWIEKIFWKRKIHDDIEKLKLRAEKAKLKAQLSKEKVKKKSNELNSLIKTLETAEDMKEIIGENKSELMQFAQSEAGGKLVNALIMKFGGSGEAAGSGILTAIKNMKPEEKAAIAGEFLGAIKGGDKK